MPRIFAYRGGKPQVDESAYIAPGVILVGNVTIGPGVGIWHHTVIRADVNSVVIGAGTNIQDGCLLHVDLDAPLVVGSGCTVGHGVVLHGCTLQ